jgi:hypothetical protein
LIGGFRAELLVAVKAAAKDSTWAQGRAGLLIDLSQRTSQQLAASAVLTTLLSDIVKEHKRLLSLKHPLLKETAAEHGTTVTLELITGRTKDTDTAPRAFFNEVSSIRLSSFRVSASLVCWCPY